MDHRAEFIKAAIWHGSLDEANRMLAAHPELGASDVHTAAITGDDAEVRRFIAADPSCVHAKSPPYDGDALNYLGLSKYLRLDRSRTDAFVRAATALLDAGADPNTGFVRNGERETALYGAAGVAHHPELTRLLLERGADPNDIEVVYHSPEEQGNAAMPIVVETGSVTAENLCLMLIRKIDWHDAAGVKYLLEHGADPRRQRTRGWAPLHHALERCNSVEVIRLLLDHGADAGDEEEGITAVARAAREGRADVLDEFEKRKAPLGVAGVDRLLMAVARGNGDAIRRIAAAEPALVGEVIAHGGAYLSKFMNAANHNGVRRLLDLGVSASATYTEGDGYFGIPAGALPIHIAAWFLDAAALTLLIERGADVNARHPERGMTPLGFFARGCTESYWSEWRSTEPARVLLDAGAHPTGVQLPTGYDELDALLRERS